MSRRTFGSIYRKRGRPKWYVRITLPDGRRIDRAISETKEVARGVLADMEAKIAKQQHLGVMPVERRRFEEFEAEYLRMVAKVQTPKTLRSTSQRLGGTLRPAFRGRWLDEVTRAEVERFVKARAEEGASVATRNRDLCVLSAFYKKAIALGHARENPTAQVPRPREVVREVPFLDIEMQERVIAACEEPMRPLVHAALRTGMRQSELLALTWNCVDFTRKVLRVTESKNKTPREVPLTFDVEPVLRALAAEAAQKAFGGAVAPPASAPARVFGHLPPVWCGQLQRLWRETKNRAGLLPEFRFHDLRHVALSTMMANGLPLTALMRVSGHKSLAAVQRYLHFAPGAAADAARVVIERAVRMPREAAAEGR